MLGRRVKEVDTERSSGSGSPRDGSPRDGQVGPESTPHIEAIQTDERVGTHEDYYEKGGLRTEGDGQDHEGVHYKMNPRLFMALTALSFLWVGSQIPLYLFGSVLVTVYSEIGGTDRWLWCVIGYSVALAAVSPFVGALSDLIGRRYVAVVGSFFIILGSIVCAVAHDMNTEICGFVFTGTGAGICELTALAGAGELVPTRTRGAYVGAIVFTISPFIPSALYAQLINRDSTWRWIGLVCGLWQFVGILLTLIFYWPPPRVNSAGYSRRKILQRIDWMGGLLVTAGVILMLMGFQWSDSQYAWTSVHVLVPFILGLILLILWVFWELYGTNFPMVPRRLAKDPKILSLTMMITFLSGANFYALLLFWPTESYNVYGFDPVGIGIRTLPVGCGIILGAVISLVLIGLTGGRIRLTLCFFTAMMTAGTGALTIALPNNLGTMWGIISIASLGVGGVIVPCSIIATIICPDDLIATITALTISVRTLGGAIGFAIYYNVFYHRFVSYATEIVGIRALAQQLLQLNATVDTQVVTLAGFAEIAALENITNSWKGTPYAESVILGATQWAYAEAYAWPYYISIAFGVATFICAMFLGDITKYLDDHVAVIVE